jgi:hypothetical protein
MTRLEEKTGTDMRAGHKVRQDVDDDLGLVAMEDIKQALLHVAGQEELLALVRRQGH